MKCNRKDRIYYCVQCDNGGLDPVADVCCNEHEILFCDECWEAGIEDLDCWEPPYKYDPSVKLPEGTDTYIQPVYTAPLELFEIKVTFK